MDLVFFHRPVFPLGVILRVFLSYFVFPFKNKTKISGDSKNFLKKNNFFKIKSELAPFKWETHVCMNAGSIKPFTNLIDINFLEN